MQPSATPTQYLDRPGGRVAYSDDGEGPLVVCVPGLGDIRASYRFLAPRLIAAGYRVVCTDLRGHGDSDAGFDAYGDEPTAGDIAALIERVGEPAAIVGNSMAAASAVLTAAADPAQVSALVLVGPFVREPMISAVKMRMLRIAMARPFVAATWKAYLPKLYAGAKPDDLDEHRRAIAASLRAPGHARALSLTSRTSHAVAEQALGSVAAPTLVVMGALDPDFPDPAAEARWIAERLHGSVTIVPDAGHYPHVQQPELVALAIQGFLTEVLARA